MLAGSSVGCKPPPLTPNGVVATFGGVGLGNGDFSYPRAITATPHGDIYIVDKSARIQRFDADGTFQFVWRTPKKQAGKPVGLTVHTDGRIFVADTHYHRVLIYDDRGTLLDQFGQLGNGDGQFQLPTDVAIDDEGFIYVSEYNGNDRVTKWAADLTFVAQISPPLVEGLDLKRPAGIDLDAEQTLWIADACNHRIIRLSRDGQVLSVFGEMGNRPGQLRYPYDITVTPDQTLLVCEYGNSRLQWFDQTGRSLATWGGPGRNLGQLSSPWGATVGKDGLIYVVDSLNSRVQIIER